MCQIMCITYIQDTDYMLQAFVRFIIHLLGFLPDIALEGTWYKVSDNPKLYQVGTDYFWLYQVGPNFLRSSHYNLFN